MLRDDNIMNPKNLVFKDEPGEDPDFNSDKLKHIHNAECINHLIIITMINMDMIKIASYVV